jgi:hypothetical protein
MLNAAYSGTFTFSLVHTAWYTTNSTALFYADSDTNEEASIKGQLRKGTARTLNIYTWEPKDGSSGGNTLGWATFPWQYNTRPSLDGVVLLHSTINGGSCKGYNLGDTAVHEVGHWAGLYHTFQVRKQCSLLVTAQAHQPAAKQASSNTKLLWAVLTVVSAVVNAQYDTMSGTALFQNAMLVEQSEHCASPLLTSVTVACCRVAAAPPTLPRVATL